MKKHLLILFLFFGLGILDAGASHLMGGEVTWTCQKSGPNLGRFKFTVKLYRDCNGIPYPPSITLTSNAPGAASINCNLISAIDLSPSLPAGQVNTGPNRCPTCADPNGQPNAANEVIYESNFITITGVPPATGWYFSYSDCCRNGAIVNLGASGSGSFTLRALMFPYNATNTNPCYDSSPRFAERPQLATVLGNLTTYSSNAVDEEGDSLRYDWAHPLDGGAFIGSTNYPFATGYSFTSPTPSPTQNPSNVAAVLDPVSGIVSFTAFSPTGAFVTVNKVTAYRCGIKIAEIYREIQIALLPNRTVANTVVGSTFVGNSPPDIAYTPVTWDTVGINQFADTVFAGDSILINLQARDNEYLAATATGPLQKVTFSVTGVALDTTQTANTGKCPFPPCAYLNKTVPTTPATAFNTIQLKWNTDCNHLPVQVGCVVLKSAYNFVVKAFDNFCPSPAVNFYTFTVVVVAPPEMAASTLYCADVAPSGNVTLTWNIPPDTGVIDTVKYFKKHFIYRSIANGPFLLLDSDSIVSNLSYTDLTANANTGPIRYYLETKSGCDLRPRPESDTLSTMFLQVNQVGTDASLIWNPIRTPLPAGSGKYYIYKESLPAGSGIWTLIDSVANNITNYLDPITVCNDSVNYYVSLTNSIGNCISRSNIDGDTLTSAIPNINPPSLRCVSVLPNEDIQINWVGTADTASFFSSYEVYHSLAFAGPYTKIGTVTNYPTNSFTHLGAQGNAQIHYYYIKTKAGCNSTSITESVSTSDTLASMKLNLNNATVGFADLAWNPIRTPLPATSNGIYNIYRRVLPSAAWVARGTSLVTTFRDTVTLCDTLIQYKVEIGDASGCISTSSDSSARFTSLGDIIDNPSLRCLAVQPNGDVQVSWVAPADPDNFFSKYEVYSSPNPAGPYTLVGTVNSYLTTTFLHTGAGANAASKYYYLKSYSGCTGLADNGSTSDTLRTMFLTVSNAAVGFADLAWNQMHVPALPSAASKYIIKRRSTGVGPYAVIDSTANLTYRDTIDICNIPYEYTVELSDNAPCTSVSSAANAIFTYIGNVINNPDLRCVSVQNNGQVLLTFIPPAGSSTNFNEYEVYRNAGAGFVLYDSISNFAATTYLDVNANGNNQAYSYYLLTQSGCTGQVNSVANSATLSSIYLTTSGVLGQATMNWSALASPLPATITSGQYDVLSSYLTGSLSFLGDTAQLVYFENINNCDTTLLHQIRVTDQSGCVSNSNIDTNDFTYIGNVINNPDLRCVSVQNNGQVLLTFIPPTGSSANFNEYEVYRNAGAGFVLYDSISNFAATTYLDVNANGNNQSYSYYLRTQSGCTGQVNSVANSATLSSIYLTTSGVLGQATMNWSALASPLPATITSGQYDVYTSYLTGNSLSFLGDTALLTYKETINNCDTTLLHQIRVTDQSGCVSNSNIDTNDFTYIGNVINNPDLRCVSVQNNGQVLLTFIPPAGSSTNFNEYEVYRNAGAGFVLYDSISNFAATTYLDVNANGNNQSYSYYLRTQSGCTGQVNSVANSATLSSIYLTTSGVLGQATMNWSALASPLPATVTSGQYDVLSSYLTGSLSFLGDTAQLVYFENINNCDTTLLHQIRVTDQSGCVSNSNIDTNDFTYIGNVINNPDLRCVSVQNNGQVLLTFIPPAGSSTNFNEYEVYRDAGAGFVLYDSISNFAATTYLDVNANGNNQSYSYYLRTQSGCTGQVNSVANSATLSSIYLTTSGVLGQATMNWSALASPLPATVTSGQYDVLSSYLTGSLSFLGDTAQLVYFENINNCDTTLLHQIRVTDQSGCVSNSNIDTNDFTYIGNVINNPDLRCVSVQNNGQVLLTFIPPAGSSTNFNEYEVYRNAGAGFVLYDSISNFAATTYLDVNANGNNQSYSYYLRTQSGCTGQVNSVANSATLSSIYLTTSGVLGQATMNWSALASPLPATITSGQYDVLSSYLTGSLSFLGDTAQLVYFENINNCDTTLLHQIRVTDQSGCVSNSNIDTNDFTYIGNVINNPDLRCVSVQNNGQVLLTFIPPTGSSANFNEYEVYRNAGAGFVLYDSISNFAATTYLDVNANGNNQAYSYYLLTQSGCTGQVNSVANSATLSSIYLTTSGVLGQATMNWSALASPLPATVTSGQYDVLSSYLTGSLSILGDTAQLVYFENINNCDTTLLHQIRVTDQSGCVSNSNIDTNDFTYIGNVINNPELRCASVAPNGQVALTWSNPTPSSWVNFNQYNLYSNYNGAFTLIDSIEVNSTNTYLHTAANANAASISYYLVTKAGCTGQTDIGSNGNTLSTLFLTVSGGNTTQATLNWNPPTNPLLGTSNGTYLVEREFPGGSGNWTVAANVNNTVYTEPLTVCIDSVNYRVSINDNIPCTSMSNVDGEIFVDHTIPDAPSIRCANVLTNGNVDLTWVAPVDTGQRFGSYQVFAAASANGPFSLVTTITNYNTLTYSHTTANAQGASVYYYLTTKTACGGESSLPSDTLQTMKLDVINNNGVAVVTWNPLHNPELNTATATYDVYREYPAGTWNLLGTTNAPVYQWFDTINVCQAVINYRVQTGDNAGCSSTSSIDGDLFRDITKPTVALIDTVSLDPLAPSQISLSWLPSVSGDVVGYVLYHFNGASWDSVGAVSGITSSFFQFADPAAALAPQLYSISAYDSCGNISNIGTAHSTLFSTAKLDVCRAAIDVRWNPYINMAGGVAQYNVYVSENNGPFTYLASVPGNNISYSHTTLTKGNKYCYYIQAQGNIATRTASSTISCEIADLLTEPTFSYLKKATVIDDRRVIVEVLVDTLGNPDVSRYKLQRSFERTGPFATISVINYTGTPIITFADFTARTDEYSYFYRVITIDSCGNEVLTSNLGRTILLSGQPEFNLTNRLTFNDYEEWLGSVREYALFRKVDDTWETTPVDLIAFGQNNYTDDVADIYQNTGRFCYRIEAYEGPGNTYGYTDTSVSNIFCLIQEPHLFVPNAFTPGGKNPLLKPQFIFIEAKNYIFAVFNRWGQKVYETRNPQDGWDGKYQGSIAPEGNYVYSVRIFGTNGREIEKSGSVTLLR